MVNSFPSIAQTLANRIEFAIQNMRENLTENDSIASDNLRAGIRFDTKIFGTKVECNIIMADYWENVDKGQKPGNRPALNKILLWMAHKGIDAKPTIRQRKATVRGSKDRKIVMTINREQIAQRIINKIYRVGTKPTYFASDVINAEWQTRVAEQLRAAGAKDVRFTLNIPKETRI